MHIRNVALDDHLLILGHRLHTDQARYFRERVHEHCHFRDMNLSAEAVAGAVALLCKLGSMETPGPPPTTRRGRVTHLVTHLHLPTGSSGTLKSAGGQVANNLLGDSNRALGNVGGLINGPKFTGGGGAILSAAAGLTGECLALADELGTAVAGMVGEATFLEGPILEAASLAGVILCALQEALMAVNL